MFTAPPYSPPQLAAPTTAGGIKATAAVSAEVSRAGRRSRLSRTAAAAAAADGDAPAGRNGGVTKAKGEFSQQAAVVLVTHGSMNPVHLGHIDVRASAQRLRCFPHPTA